MKRIFLWVFVVFLLGGIGATAGELPKKVADLLGRAIVLSDEDGFSGSYKMKISSVIQKTNGKSRKESVIEIEVTQSETDTKETRLIRFLEDGVDVTEKHREEIEEEDEKDRDKNSDETEENETTLSSPFGEDAENYEFGAVRLSGSDQVITFRPKPGFADSEEAASGRIAWNKDTLEPLWVEMTALNPPKPMKKLQLRMEYSKLGNEYYVSHMITDGLAKVLLMKREFHMDMRFSAIRPEDLGNDTGLSEANQ